MPDATNLQRIIKQHDKYTRAVFRHSEIEYVLCPADVAIWRRFNPQVREMLKTYSDDEVFAVIDGLLEAAIAEHIASREGR